MEYRKFILGELETNCYLVWSGKTVGVIDPGGSVDAVIRFCDQHELQPQWIINTHGHGDHIAGNAALQQRYGVPILIHAADRSMLLSARVNLSEFYSSGVVSPDAAQTLEDGEEVTLGEEKLKVLATPGHTPGGISLYTTGLLFSGDSLFRESVGRSDFPGGNHRLLIEGISDRLLVLPPDTVVLPGHGEATTIGHESRYNPFLGGISAL